MKYTLGRLALFALAAAALLPFGLDLLVTLMIALLVSMVLSYVLLRTWREELAVQIEESRQRRREEKDKLRRALAGEDEGPGAQGAAGQGTKADREAE